MKKNKYFYPIFKLKIKSWIKYWLIKKTEFKGKLSEILEGFSFTLNNTLSMKFNLFEIYGNSIQDGEPSPDNEVPILNAGDNGSITEKISNANILDTSEVKIVKNQTGDNRTGYYCKIPQTGRYLLLLNTTNTMYFGKSSDINGLTTLIGSTNSSFSTNYDFNAGEYFVIWGTKTDTDKLMVKLADGQTDYVPHEEQDYSIEVQQPMRSIGDVRDCFVKKSDGWYERHYIGKVVLDGTESWGIRNQGDGSTTISFNHNMTNLGSTDLICNKFTQSLRSTNGVEGIGIPSQLIQIYIQIKRDRLTSLDVLGITTWLSENNVLLDYILATPLDLPCTEEQIEILENLPKTFAGQTTVFSIDKVKPYLRVQYYKE